MKVKVFGLATRHEDIIASMHASDDDTEARRLSREVRVLIWVMTAPQNLQTKARIVRDTWGLRANKLIFFSSETNKDFPTIGLNVSEGREHLTAKTTGGFRYIYNHHLEDADWFMKVSVRKATGVGLFPAGSCCLFTPSIFCVCGGRMRLTSQ